MSVKEKLKKIPLVMTVWRHLVWPVFRHFYQSWVYQKCKSVKYHKLFVKTKLHYQNVAKTIKEREDAKLRFACYVVYSSSFGGYGIMDLMLKNPSKYSPKIVICPDVARGVENLKNSYIKTKNFFIEKYGEDYVVDGYDQLNNEFIDVSEQFDVIYCANPYDGMVNKVHGIEYLSKKNVLPIYINYGFSISKWHFKSVERSLELSLFYKYFADTTYTLTEIKKYNLNKAKNVILSGYSKMDDLKTTQEKKSSKLKILLSPHHTIKGINSDLQLSNFLEYSDLILKLADMYPDIEFVFRPHPLLFINLINSGIWSQNQVDDYIKKIKNKGIEYSTGGDYLHLFSECDAIIHDCGSYMVEWLYTGKPCCYVVDNERKLRKQLCLLGNKALDFHFLAHNENEIIKFVDDLKHGSKFYYPNNEIEKNIMINYPNASKFILENIL